MKILDNELLPKPGFPEFWEWYRFILVPRSSHASPIPPTNLLSFHGHRQDEAKPIADVISSEQK